MVDVLTYILVCVGLITLLLCLLVSLTALIFSIIYVVTGNDPDEVVDNIIKYVWLKKHRSEHPGMIEDSLSVLYRENRRVCIHFHYYSDDGRELSHTEYFKRYKRKNP